MYLLPQAVLCRQVTGANMKKWRCCVKGEATVGARFRTGLNPASRGVVWGVEQNPEIPEARGKMWGQPRGPTDGSSRLGPCVPGRKEAERGEEVMCSWTLSQEGDDCRTSRGLAASPRCAVDSPTMGCV